MFPVDFATHQLLYADPAVPKHNLDAFLHSLEDTDYLKEMPIKYAVEDDGKSFYKLIVRHRKNILADGLDDNAYDVTNVGKQRKPPRK